VIVKVKGGFGIKSHKTGKVWPKVYSSKTAAQERLNQMEKFKHMNKAIPRTQVFHKEPPKVQPRSVSPDYYMRTRIGHIEKVKKPQGSGFRVHFADGTKHEVEASSKWEALQKVKHLSKLAPIKVEGIEKSVTKRRWMYVIVNK